MSSVSDIAKDVLAGKNFVQSTENRINSAIDNVKEKTESALEGKGIKRKKLNNKIILLKKNTKRKKRSLDIFD